jgi:ribonuclease P protein component
MHRPRGATRRRPRLSRSADFQRVYRQGDSVASRYFVMYAFPREAAADEPGEGQRAPDGGLGQEVRFGVSVGRRVGGAVERNRVKRLLREAFWALPGPAAGSHDYVVVARQGAAELAEAGGLESYRAELESLLDRLELDEGPPEAGDSA